MLMELIPDYLVCSSSRRNHTRKYETANCEEFAMKKYIHFRDNGLNGYKEGRNFPAKENVSVLSPHLHFGEISPLQVYHDIQNDKKINILNKNKFLAELGWRDF